jgi:hypothetical protein
MEKGPSGGHENCALDSYFWGKSLSQRIVYYLIIKLLVGMMSYPRNEFIAQFFLAFLHGNRPILWS